MIRVDNRETQSTKKILHYIEEVVGKDNVHEEQLLVGDICDFEKGICIERKTVGDLYGSINSGHIFRQVQQMRENYPNNFILVSGKLSDLLEKPEYYKLNTNVVDGAMASLVAKYQIPIISCETDKRLAYLACKIIEKFGKPIDMVPIERLSASPDDRRIAAVTAVKGVSYTKAKMIFEKFGSVSALCNASIDQLMEVDGIGEKTAISIKEIFV